jgi:hypothetical protein
MHGEPEKIEANYREMAHDVEREAAALEWIEAMVADNAILD